MSGYKSVILDLDGTLIDSSEGVVDAVNYSLRMLGEREQRPEAITRFIGYSLKIMYPHFSKAPYEELRRHFQDRAAHTIVTSTRPLPGADIVLRELSRRGYTLAVASTKITRHIEGIISKCGWREFISVFSGGDEVEQVKPAPEILNLTLSRMNADPAQTMMIGDTINDVHAARAASLTVTAVNSPYGGRQSLIDSKPDFFVESLEEVLGILP